MAGADRMTIEEVVKRVLLDEQADVLRAAVEAVCARWPSRSEPSAVSGTRMIE